MIHFLLHIFGLDNASGVAYLTWSGVLGDASILGGFVAWMRRSRRQHVERMAQSASQHQSLMQLHREHHEAHLSLLRKHHSQALDAAAPAAPAAERITPKRGDRM